MRDNRRGRAAELERATAAGEPGRWKMIDNGQRLEVTFTVEDPDTYYEPWSGIRRYRRVQQEMAEEACAENNAHLFEYHIPVADKPDF